MRGKISDRKKWLAAHEEDPLVAGHRLVEYDDLERGGAFALLFEEDGIVKFGGSYRAKGFLMHSQVPCVDAASVGEAHASRRFSLRELLSRAPGDVVIQQSVFVTKETR